MQGAKEIILLFEIRFVYTICEASVKLAGVLEYTRLPICLHPPFEHPSQVTAFCRGLFKGRTRTNTSLNHEK